ncbi:phage tail protein [Brevibacillus parabrevis]|uniref:phage tail protein n=1 Tax=Brevibacillus parabrevis TaxID=54914 RepID=UPI0007ABC21D|nr:tail fiber protein [Brevibacillus parabrevis]KZE52392.1 phage tail protein [Brevibacillus parabrevis]
MEAYYGEIRIFTGQFAPRGWAFCDGSLLQIRQNTALYSILGTRFGGDGTTTFALPNLQGAAPMHHGAAPDLTPRTIGEQGGSSEVRLTVQEMPGHTHIPNAAEKPTTNDPAGTIWSNTEGRGRVFAYGAPNAPEQTTFSQAALSATGEGMPHNNRQPFLAVRYIICLEGEFPQRP